MNAARRAAVAAAVLLMPVSVLAVGHGVVEGDGGGPSAAAAAPPQAAAVVTTQRKVAGARTARKVGVRTLPAIAQSGRKTANPNRARVAVVTTVKPKRATQVRLQVKVGTKWKVLRTATTARNGRHTFTAPLRRNGKPATYRVRVGKRVSKPASTERWVKPSFSDAFNGRKLGPAWNHRSTHYDSLNRQCSRGGAKATRVRNGTVRLSVIKDPKRKRKCVALRDGKSTGRYAYRINGHIGTQESYTFTYGVAAARIKFPRQSGQHGAFWMQVDRPDLSTINARRNGTEIDVVESYGHKMGTEVNALGLTTGVHRFRKKQGQITTQSEGGWVPNAGQYLSGKKNTFWNSYHVFSVEWTPNYYIYRIDGQEYWRTHRGISGTAQFPVLSMLSSDYELYRLDGGDKGLPQHMHVDWMRVWETHPGQGS